MNKIILVGTNEGSFDYNRNIVFADIKDKEIEIQLHTDIVFKAGTDNVLLRMFVRYMQNKEQIISYDVSLGFKVIDWQILIKDMKDEDILKTEEVLRMIVVTIGFLRGSLSLQERTTPFKKAFLPLIDDINALIKDVSIYRLKEDTTK